VLTKSSKPTTPGGGISEQFLSPSTHADTIWRVVNGQITLYTGREDPPGRLQGLRSDQSFGIAHYCQGNALAPRMPFEFIFDLRSKNSQCSSNSIHCKVWRMGPSPSAKEYKMFLFWHSGTWLQFDSTVLPAVTDCRDKGSVIRLCHNCT